MKKIFIHPLMLVLILMSVANTAISPELAEFNRQLESNGLIFENPEDFTPWEIDKNKCGDVNYYYAIKHKSKKLEVRYSAFPFIKAVKEPNHVELGSNSTYKMFTLTVLLNMAGDEKNLLGSAEFDTEAVKDEFNADWGSSYLVKPESNFGKGYKLAMIIALYKSGSGYGYSTFLFDDYKEVQPEIMAAFHSMRFKSEKM